MVVLAERPRFYSSSFHPSIFNTCLFLWKIPTPTRRKIKCFFLQVFNLRIKLIEKKRENINFAVDVNLRKSTCRLLLRIKYKGTLVPFLAQFFIVFFTKFWLYLPNFISSIFETYFWPEGQRLAVFWFAKSKEKRSRDRPQPSPLNWWSGTSWNDAMHWSNTPSMIRLNGMGAFPFTRACLIVTIVEQVTVGVRWLVLAVCGHVRHRDLEHQCGFLPYFNNPHF